MRRVRAPASAAAGARYARPGDSLLVVICASGAAWPGPLPGQTGSPASPPPEPSPPQSAAQARAHTRADTAASLLDLAPPRTPVNITGT